MKRITSFLLLAAAFSVMGCASTEKLTLNEPVGPGKTEVTRTGALQVFTATETHQDGEDTYYYPHTAYFIYDQQGHKVKYVPNHVGTADETPSVVFLPTGSYVVIAEAEGYGRVRIPVVIEPSRTTELHLERGWQPPANAKASDVARMSDGHPVGWLANTAGAHSTVVAKEHAP